MITKDKKQRILIRLSLLVLLFSLVVLLPSPLALRSFAARGGRPHAFVRPDFIITAEINKETEIILNIINLSDYAAVFESKNLIVRSGSGKVSIGQVIDLPETDNTGNTWKYRASVLVHPKTSQGFSVLGAYRDLDNIETSVVRIGGRRYVLEPLTETQFNALAAKISELDLKGTDFQRVFEQVDIRNLGRVTFPAGEGDPDADLRGLLTADGANPPRVIARRLPSPTAEAIKAGVQGVVKISGTVTRDGDFVDPKVVKGLGYGLDARALEAVKNSWKFLPATKGGEVVTTTVTVDVEFDSSRR